MAAGKYRSSTSSLRRKAQMREKRRECVPFFFCFLRRRIYGLIRRRNLAVALTPLSRLAPLLNTLIYIRVYARKLSALGVSNASCFIFRARARGVMGGVAHALDGVARTPSRNREYLWGIRRRRDEKSLANLRRALCCRSAKSRIHRECDCWRQTYLRPPRPCISPSRVLLFPRSVKSKRERSRDREVYRAKESSNGSSVWRVRVARIITLFIYVISRNLRFFNEKNLVDWLKSRKIHLVIYYLFTFSLRLILKIFFLH